MRCVGLISGLAPMHGRLSGKAAGLIGLHRYLSPILIDACMAMADIPSCSGLSLINKSGMGIRNGEESGAGLMAKAINKCSKLGIGVFYDEGIWWWKPNRELRGLSGLRDLTRGVEAVLIGMSS